MVCFAKHVDGLSSASEVPQSYDAAKLAFVASQFDVCDAPEKKAYRRL